MTSWTEGPIENLYWLAAHDPVALSVSKTLCYGGKVSTLNLDHVEMQLSIWIDGLDGCRLLVGGSHGIPGLTITISYHTSIQLTPEDFSTIGLSLTHLILNLI